MYESVTPELLEVVADCFTGATIKKECAEFHADMNWKSGSEPVCHTQHMGSRCDSTINVNGDQKDDAFSLRKYRYWFLMIAVLDTSLPEEKYLKQKAATQKFF